MSSGLIRKIHGQETVIAALGYWPEFCDAKCRELTFSHHNDLEASLSFILHYIDMDKRLDLNVKIVLTGISRLEFHDLAMENVINCIEFINFDNETVECSIESASGLYGSCFCKRVDVELVSIKKMVI